MTLNIDKREGFDFVQNCQKLPKCALIDREYVHLTYCTITNSMREKTYPTAFVPAPVSLATTEVVFEQTEKGERRIFFQDYECTF